MKTIQTLLSLCFINLSVLLAEPSFQSPSISYETALKVVTEVLNEAKERDIKLAVSIADPSGHLVAFGRTDGTKPIVLEVAQGKAYSSAVARNKTSIMQEKALPGGPAYGGVTSLKGIVTIRGGVPIFYKGECIGGLGVSGTSAAEDEEIAELVLKRLKLE